MKNYLEIMQKILDEGEKKMIELNWNYKLF